MKLNTDLDQYFTKPDGAATFVEWATRPVNEVADLDVLEPSAGSGNLVAAILDVRADIHVTAVEIDPYFVDMLERRFAGDPRVTVVSSRFEDFARKHQAVIELGGVAPFDLAVMNPPYRFDRDVRHVELAARISRSAAALVRLPTKVGRERAVFWRTHRLARELNFTDRPEYESAQGFSAKTDFLGIHVVKREVPIERGARVQDYVASEWT